MLLPVFVCWYLLIYMLVTVGLSRGAEERAEQTSTERLQGAQRPLARAPPGVPQLRAAEYRDFHRGDYPGYRGHSGVGRSTRANGD